MKVCVVGAGLAGLTAADELARAGANVTLLEAAERVGGRVWSDRLPGGGLYERGGEFITAGYDATTALAARHGLDLCRMGIRYPDRELRPDPGLDRDSVLASARELAGAAAREPAGSAAARLLKRVVDDPDVRELFAARVQSAVAYPFEDLDARFLTKVPSLLDDLETRRIAGGNQLLAEALADSLPGDVHLGARVEAIRIRDGGLAIRAAGSELVADCCVLAVPCRLVSGIELDPPPPRLLTAELDSIPMSSAAKLVVPLREPVPQRAVMSVPHRFWAWVTRCDGVGGRLAGSWAGGSPVIDALDARSGDPGTWLAHLRELWPDLDLVDPEAVITVWDPGSPSRGAYSVLRRDRPGPDDAGDPRIALAGEYTAAEWSGTIEGAIRSGRSAAERLLARG